MPDIVLATLNAKYIHASVGLRYLLANLGPLRTRAELIEFEIHQAPVDIVEALLDLRPRVIGIGVYIWNARPTLEVVALLKRLRPEVKLVLGGPEISHEWDRQELASYADHIVAGEADLAFPRLCRHLLDEAAETAETAETSWIGTPRSGLSPSGWPKVLDAGAPDLAEVALPYDLYTDEDLAHRVIYVEASRGCPFTCEFCLSSLDVPVRAFPLERFLHALERLLGRGARQFKFVDRTFNLNIAVSLGILRFFRERWRDGLFLHFEMIPDRLPEALREEIAWFPAGALQFEIGIQSFNPEVCARIRRRQDPRRTEDNLRFLRERTGVHIHADLIAGLPGETLESFAAGFDRLVALGPQEIQFGILKRLRGTPIVRHDGEWGMRYNPMPPYEIVENRDLDFATLQRLRRFARFWDLVANSGRFVRTTPLVWSGGRSPFGRFLAFSDWLYAGLRRTQAIALDRLAERLFRWLISENGVETRAAAEALAADWRSDGRRDLPPWLAAHVPAAAGVGPGNPRRSGGQRQARHLRGAPVALHAEERGGSTGSADGSGPRT